MTTTEEIGAGLHAVLDAFVAVCGAPDDAGVALAADDALARLDALIGAAGTETAGPETAGR